MRTHNEYVDYLNGDSATSTHPASSAENGHKRNLSLDEDWERRYDDLLDDMNDLYRNETNMGKDTGMALFPKESPFYYMEYYNQDRRKVPPEEPHLDTQVTSPAPFSSHLPELTDYEAENFPEPVQSLLPLKETDSAKHQQQRDFLLTTLLPICAFIILVLMVTLVVIWFLKFRGSSKTTEKRDVAAKEAQEPLAMTEDGWNGKKNGITSKADMNHDKTLSTDDTDGLSPHPSKPLIFPNEKPPLKPPDILNTMNKNIVHSPESQLQPRPVMPSTHQINMRPYYAMGPRPDPYRNLPPPIDSRFGLPRQMTPTFGYYRRDPAV
ncbi:unnamed protein product [Schistocephalus solidus]|uniref:Neural proliferation differentiation and control protein 1 n=1 Tax=Schistocephalus solidus TaxID=70667 RepID=A0A0V0J6Q8_SCHSO|nr:unnamed protein product [Schistocephalus solidus]